MKLLNILGAPWAIVPEKLLEIQSIYKTHLHGEKIDIKGLEEKFGVQFQSGQEPRERRYAVQKGIAIISIEGVITKKLNFFSCLFGGTSTELVGEAMKEAMEDTEVDSILLHIDSPGGSVDGTFELAELIYSFRGEKPINAYTDGLMASAAYCIGSAADKIYISGDTTIVGSIGVITTHIDASKFYEDFGLNITDIYAGKYKAVGSQHKSLSEGDLATIQSRIDYIYGTFVDTIAKHRKTDTATVLSDMADGRIFIGEQAIKAGLVDGVSTMDNLIATLGAAGDVAYTMESKNLNMKEGEVMKDGKDQGIPASSITAEYLAANHPDIVGYIKTEGFEAGKVEGLKIGADTERQRIQDVEAQGMPGQDKLISELKFDGKTTGPEAAVKVLNAERVKVAGVGTGLEADAGDISVDAAEPGDQGLAAGDATSQFDAKVKEHMKDEGCKRSVAIKAVMEANPDLHKKYLSEANKK